MCYLFIWIFSDVTFIHLSQSCQMTIVDVLSIHVSYLPKDNMEHVVSMCVDQIIMLTILFSPRRTLWVSVAALWAVGTMAAIHHRRMDIDCRPPQLVSASASLRVPSKMSPFAQQQRWAAPSLMAGPCYGDLSLILLWQQQLQQPIRSGKCRPSLTIK